MKYILGFGTYRYLLSLLVLFHHLGLWIPLANRADWGLHAVLSFFVLSGYMIASILDRAYSGKNRNARFFMNRYLRLIPAHWAVMLFLVVTFYLVPEAMLGWGMGKGAINPIKTFSPLQWLGNLILIGNVNLINFVTWTLRLELILYLLALLLFSRHRYLAFMGLIVGWISTLFMPLPTIGNYPLGFIGSMFPFNLGMCIYYWRDKVPALPTSICIWSVLTSLLFIVGLKIFGIEKEVSCHLSIILTGMATCVLQSRQDVEYQQLNKADEILGDLSYSIYLIHKPVMIWIGWYATTRHLFGPDSLWFVAFMFIFSHTLGLSINFGVERPFKTLRKRIRYQTFSRKDTRWFGRQ